jgi:hypothetical protein
VEDVITGLLSNILHLLIIALNRPPSDRPNVVYSANGHNLRCRNTTSLVEQSKLMIQVKNISKQHSPANTYSPRTIPCLHLLTTIPCLHHLTTMPGNWPKDNALFTINLQITLYVCQSRPWYYMFKIAGLQKNEIG